MQHRLHNFSALALSIATALTATPSFGADDVENVMVIGKYVGTKPSQLAGSVEIIGRDQIEN